MKVRHYRNSFGNENPHWTMTRDFGPSNTDISFYRPDISAVRAFAGNPSGSNMRGLYDFPDGKDTGQRMMMILRDKSLDPTEIEKIGEIIKAKVNSGQIKDVHAAEREALGLSGKKLLDWVSKYIESNPLPTVPTSQPQSTSVSS